MPTQRARGSRPDPPCSTRPFDCSAASELGPAYEDAWADWAGSVDEDLWDHATGDGLR